MELTGECKEDFEQWLVCSSGSFAPYYDDLSGEYDSYNWFNNLPTSMQWGVLVDFFDSKDIDVRANRQKLPNGNPYYDSYTNGYLGAWVNMDEARTEAIKKANHIYNAN